MVNEINETAETRLWTPESLRELEAAYTTEQRAAIETLLADIARDRSGFCDYPVSTALTQRGRQVFAVFGTLAYGVWSTTVLDAPDGRVEYLPLVIDGHMRACWPDEGSSGLYYLMRVTHRRGKVVAAPTWTAVALSCGWLWTRELGLSSAEIRERLADEMDS